MNGIVERKRRRPDTRVIVFFFNDTATTEIYTLSLHDALPIFALGLVVYLCFGAIDAVRALPGARVLGAVRGRLPAVRLRPRDRKSTRLNSSHANISYAVFCLKKKKPCCPFSRRPTPFDIFIIF